MTYDDTVLSVTQTSHIATTFQEVEEVLSTEIETIEFIPLEEIVFEVFEEPEMVAQIFEEIYIEEIAKEEINTGIVEIFTVAVEEEIIPMEIVYEEPKAIETFTTEVQGFEERIETTETFSETEIKEFAEEIISEEITAEAPVEEATPETVEQTESNISESETETTVASEEVNEVNGEGETTDSRSGNGGAETVAQREETLKGS